MKTTTLILAKQNFKFSAGHFLIFNETEAERLHGHNYQVRVLVKAPSEFDQKENPQGYYIDFKELKKVIKARLDQWDEVVLLPKNNPEMKFITEGNSLEVKFRDRRYVFPKNEVLLLPTTNTSVEQLSKILAEDLYKAFKKFGVAGVRVTVEETPGQGAASYFGA